MGNNNFYVSEKGHGCPACNYFTNIHSFYRENKLIGAIMFLSGANIMCPGLTSPGAVLTPAEKGTTVAVIAEGKEHARAIGITPLSTNDIMKIQRHRNCNLSLSE